jgi:hypothetical protein
MVLDVTAEGYQDSAVRQISHNLLAAGLAIQTLDIARQAVLAQKSKYGASVLGASPATNRLAVPPAPLAIKPTTIVGGKALHHDAGATLPIIRGRSVARTGRILLSKAKRALAARKNVKLVCCKH